MTFRATQAGLWQNPERVTDPAQRRIFQSLTSYLCKLHEPVWFDLEFQANQAITTATSTKPQWDVADDPIGFLGTALDDFITIPAGCGGIYVMSASIQWQANATGRRRLWFTINDTTVQGAADVFPGTAATASHVSHTTSMRLEDGDTVEVYVDQTSGGNLNANVNSRTQWRGVRAALLGSRFD